MSAPETISSARGEAPTGGAQTGGAPTGGAPTGGAQTGGALTGQALPPARAAAIPSRLRRPLASAAQLSARTPLRIKLVAALLALVAVALLATGLAVTTGLRGYLVQQVDQDLAGPIGDIRAENQNGASPFGRSRAEYLRIASLDGATIGEQVFGPAVSSPNISDRRILAAGSAPFTVPARGSGPDWRVVVGQSRIRGTPVLVVRAISLGELDSTLNRLVLIEILFGVVVLLLLAGVAYVVVRRSLRPLVEVEETAAAIAAGDLTRRVPERDPRTEVGRLSLALNGMLTQIEHAFYARATSEAAARASEQRMRRFVADASHELRTPLTSIRGFAELYRQGAVVPADVPSVMRRVEDQARRMGLLVDDLLLLARLDQQRPLERCPVDLLAIASDVVHDAEATTPGRPVTLALADDGPAPVVLGDEARLRQVVANLVSNALTHTPDGTPVAVTVGTDAGGVLLRVADRGPGLSPDEAERVFERFYRADPSRARSAGGSGLGLSIVAALVAAHAGTVTVDTAPGQGATFTVHLPLHRTGAVPTSV